jgi:antitoxin (DNA-binding transcriptional repressor) of toxin-antitoxin stability system
MKTVGLKVLKNKLSEYVRIAAGGETVQVTDRGRVVVEMNAPQPHKDRKKESVIERGIREGWITPAKNPRSGPPPSKPIVTLDELMNELEQDREDRI